MTSRTQTNRAGSPVTWVIVADRGRAAIYKLDKGDNKTRLSVVHELICPEGRAHPHDLVSDQQGYFKGRSGSLDAGDPQTQFRQRAAIKFARQVSTELSKALQAKQFDQMAVIAAPGFLGALRGAMNKQLKQSIIAQVARDLTAHPKQKLEKQVGEIVDTVTIVPESNHTVSSLAEDEVLLVTLLTDAGAFAYEESCTEFESIVNQFANDYSLRHVVVDCEKSDYIGSATTGFFCRLYKHVRSRGGSMVLCNISRNELEILHMMRLDETWAICESVQSGIEAVGAEISSISAT